MQLRNVLAMTRKEARTMRHDPADPRWPAELPHTFSSGAPASDGFLMSFYSKMESHRLPASAGEAQACTISPRPPTRANSLPTCPC